MENKKYEFGIILHGALATPYGHTALTNGEKYFSGKHKHLFVLDEEVEKYTGLIKNNYKVKPQWIKSCENFRSGVNPYKQPKYFHTDDEVFIRDWYRSAYPSDNWGAIDPDLRFKDVCLKWEGTDEDRTLYIKDNHGRYLDFNDSIIRKRIELEIDVNNGFSFGYIIED